MKKLLLFFLAVLLSQMAFCQALSGSYTIGTGEDYVGIQAAIDDMAENGISGPVTFNIASGTYNASSVLPLIEGSSAINTITFQAESENADDVILSAYPVVFTVGEAASHIIFKHLSFNIESGTCLNITSHLSTNIVITDCKFFGATGGYETFGIGIYAGSNQTTIEDNFFYNCSTGVYRNTTSSGAAVLNNVVVKNNDFTGGMIYGLYFSRMRDLTIEGNNFGSGIEEKVIYGEYLAGETIVSSNEIYSENEELSGQPALDFRGVSNEDSNITIVNNFISIKTHLATEVFENIYIYHNSFKSTTYCLRAKDDNILDSVNIYNNIFQSPPGVPNVWVVDTFGFTELSSDYNAYSNTENTIAFSESIVYATYYDLPNWQEISGQDEHSIIVNTVYASDSDLHAPNSVLIDGAGLPLDTVTTDIDGEMRNDSAPDIGADEFIFDAATFVDLEITEIAAPNGVSCENEGFILAIKNNSAVTVNSFDIECVVNGIRGNKSSYEYTVVPDATIEVPITGCELRDNTLYGELEFYISQPNGIVDNNYSNDHITMVNAIVIGDFTIKKIETECESQYTLIVPQIYGTTLNWSTGDTTNKIIVTSPGTYTATLTSSEGCIVTESITIN